MYIQLNKGSAVKLTLLLILCSEEEPCTERIKLFSVPSSNSNTAVTEALYSIKSLQFYTIQGDETYKL